MFSNCCNLINLDLTSFDFKNVTNYEGFIYNCTNLCNIFINKESYNKIQEEICHINIIIK